LIRYQGMPDRESISTVTIEAPSPFRRPVPRRLLRRLADRSVAGRQLSEVRFGKGWLIAVRNGDELLRFDEHLNQLRSLAIPTRTDTVFPAIAVNHDCSLVAIAHRTGLRVFACQPARGEAHFIWDALHGPWETIESPDCAFDNSSRVWWVRPGGDSRADRIVVLDSRTHTIVAEASIPRTGYAHRVVIHPGGTAAIIESAAGQDESVLWRAVLNPNGLSVDQLNTSDRVMGGFSYDGTRFITTPHAGDGSIIIHSWPDARVVDSLAASSIFLKHDDGSDVGHDDFDYWSSFIDDQHVIVDTHQRRLLLLRTDPLELLAELWLDGYEIVAYGNRGQPVTDPDAAVDYERDLTTWSVASGRLLTRHANEHLCLWELPLTATDTG
jgi:hypothetical protein